MKLSEIRDVLSADVIYGEDIIDDVEVETAFASDLLSDVLAYSKENALFITGLTNPQVIRTAEVLDLVGVVFVRGKVPQLETVELAKRKGIPLLRTKCIMFETCGRLFRSGIKASRVMID